MYKTVKNNKPRSVKKSLKYLATSWKVQTKVFFQHSTLHGVRYIAETGRPFAEKFMWFSCVSIGVVATAVIIVSLWDKFQTNPTITGLDTDFHNWEVSFPAITICQETPYNETLIEEFFNNTQFSDLSSGITTDDLIKLSKLNYDNIKGLSYQTHKIRDLKKLSFELMNQCEEIFESCEFKSYPEKCCEIFKPVFTERGFCYTFNSRYFERDPKTESDFQIRYIKETDPQWSLKFSVKETNIKIPIYILHFDEQASLDTQPQHVWEFNANKISFSVKTTYTTEDTRQLSIKQRHCVFANEMHLDVDEDYTYTACTKQCRMDTAMKLCKCVPHFYPEVGRYKHCNLNQIKCISDNLEAIKSVDRCGCYLGCTNTVYEVEKLSPTVEENVNEMEIAFVSWPMIRYKREVLFGWVDLLVSFGGIAGLFLGFSLLSGVEILYYFTIRAWCMAVRDKDDLDKIQFEEAHKLPEDYDLSLKPYCCFDPFPGNGINEIAKGFYHKNLYNNKVVPLNGNKLNPTEKILPPFGIEFIN